MIAHMVLRSDFKIVVGGSGRADALFQPLLEPLQEIQETVPLLAPRNPGLPRLLQTTVHGTRNGDSGWY